MQESIAAREPALETNKKTKGFRNSKWVALFVVGSSLFSVELRFWSKTVIEARIEEDHLAS